MRMFGSVNITAKEDALRLDSFLEPIDMAQCYINLSVIERTHRKMTNNCRMTETHDLLLLPFSAA